MRAPDKSEAEGWNRRVTVGIAVKNSEQTVGDAIGSIIKQTYPHELMEIIIVDGGSTDKTLSIVNQMISHSGIQSRVYSDGGRGLGVARQTVVQNARGDYLVWVDADTTIPDNYVSRLVEFVDGHPRLAGARGVPQILNPTSLTARIEDLSLALGRIQQDFFDLPGIMRTEAVRDVGGFDTCIRGAGEDVDLIARMVRSGWLFSVSNARFYDTVGTWSEIWHNRMRAGYGIHYLSHKHEGMIRVWHQTFPVLCFVGLRDSAEAYRSSGQKESFLLPIFYVLKSIGWWIGYAKSHIDGYGHELPCRQDTGSRGQIAGASI